MKKIVLISAIAMSSLFYGTANAQVRVNFGFHFGPRRVYVPARVVVQEPPVVYTEPVNYDGDEDYYYLPDLDAYYSVPEQCYYYNDGERWVSAAYLPGNFHDFDWRYARHYEVRAPRPYMHNDFYRTRFNGVAFNGRGRWDNFDNNRYYHGVYVNNNRFNHDQYNRPEQHFDHDRYNRDDQHFNQYRQQDHASDQNRGRDNRGGRPSNDNRNWNRQPSNDNRNDNDHNNNHNSDNHYNGGGDQHFAQNSRPVINHDNAGSHRPGRF